MSLNSKLSTLNFTFEIAVGNPWLCRRLFCALPPPLFIDAVGLFFWSLTPRMVSLPITGRVGERVFIYSLITVQSYDIFLIYASIRRYFFQNILKKFRVI